MKKAVLFAATLLTVGAISANAADIGVVDMKKIFNVSDKVKQIKTSLTKRFASQKNSLEKMGKSLQADIQKYQKNKTVMSKKDSASLQSKITSEEMTFRAAQSKFQQSIYAAQNESLASFMNDVKAVVKKVAAKKGVDVVLPKNDVLYSKGKLDLTRQVLKSLNK